jgi:glycerophosphoryl diester phosphodiesterase
MGADGVELDIHATRDGVLVVHHDPDLEGLGAIAGHTAAELERVSLPNGEQIPTLDEALELLAGLDVWVEIKTLPPSLDSRLFQSFDRGPTPNRYAIHAFDHRIVARLGSQRPSLRRGVLLASYLLDPISVLRGVGADTLWQESSLVDQDLIRLLHRNGSQVIAWTANTEEEIGRLVELGVDGICGNYPERIRSVLSRETR